MRTRMRTRLFGLITTALAVTVLSAGVALAGPDGERKPDRPNRERAERDGERPERPDRGHRGRHGDRRHHVMAALFRGIELTDTQKQELREIGRAHREQVKAWHEEHRDELEAIREKMRQARQDKDREAAEAAREQFKQLLQTRPKPDATFDAMRGVLTTDEDKAQFDENLESIKQRFKERAKDRDKRGWREGRRPHREGGDKAKRDRDRPKRDRDGDRPQRDRDGGDEGLDI